MRIHCDGCGKEIMMEDAVEIVDGEEVLYYCSQECADREDQRGPVRDPGPAEDQTAPDEEP